MANDWRSLVMPPEEALWELFHEGSKVSRYDPAVPTPVVLARMAELWESFPYKGYPATELPKEPLVLDAPLGEVMKARATARNLVPRRLSLREVATIFHFAYGITRDNKDSVFPRPFRTVPSGGGLYPIELYFHTSQVEDLAAGLYHFSPIENSVQLIREGDESRKLAEALVQSQLALDSSLIVFLTAVFERSTFKYGDRGYRFTLIEAGHIVQNMALTAAALGLGAVPIGGFFDRPIDDLLGLDGLAQSTVYMVGIGEDRPPIRPAE
ncbi:MAG TPA: SagB family peptide dehydrogenase [Vicinamibacterales bacterium]|nr:SagB family peptide dehydrogenase [Vicinamibacterales bacterium]